MVWWWGRMRVSLGAELRFSTRTWLSFLFVFHLHQIFPVMTIILYLINNTSWIHWRVSQKEETSEQIKSHKSSINGALRWHHYSSLLIVFISFDLRHEIIKNTFDVWMAGKKSRVRRQKSELARVLFANNIKSSNVSIQPRSGWNQCIDIGWDNAKHGWLTGC